MVVVTSGGGGCGRPSGPSDSLSVCTVGMAGQQTKGQVGSGLLDIRVYDQTVRVLVLSVCSVVLSRCPPKENFRSFRIDWHFEKMMRLIQTPAGYRYPAQFQLVREYPRSCWRFVGQCLLGCPAPRAPSRGNRATALLVGAEPEMRRLSGLRAASSAQLTEPERRCPDDEATSAVRGSKLDPAYQNPDRRGRAGVAHDDKDDRG